MRRDLNDGGVRERRRRRRMAALCGGSQRPTRRSAACGGEPVVPAREGRVRAVFLGWTR